MRHDLSTLEVGSFDLVRLLFQPGKMLCVQLAGVTKGGSSGHAVAEYLVTFFQPAGVHVDLYCVLPTRLRAEKPLEIERISSEAKPQCKVHLTFDTGTLDLEASDLGCGVLRFDEFSPDDERRYRVSGQK